MHLNSETPVNTTAFRMQLSVNLGNVELSNIIKITITFSQNLLVQSLFEFVNGTSDNEFEAIDHINPSTGIIDASIILVGHADDHIYPITIAMTVTALMIFNSGGGMEAHREIVTAVGNIELAPGMIYSRHTWHK